MALALAGDDDAAAGCPRERDPQRVQVDVAAQARRIEAVAAVQLRDVPAAEHPPQLRRPQQHGRQDLDLGPGGGESLGEEVYLLEGGAPVAELGAGVGDGG